MRRGLSDAMGMVLGAHITKERPPLRNHPRLELPVTPSLYSGLLQRKVLDTGMLRTSQTEHNPEQDQEENRNSCWGGRRGRIKRKREKGEKGRQREQRRRRGKERRKERRREGGKGRMSMSCLGLESSIGLFPGSLARACGKGVQADRRRLL